MFIMEIYIFDCLSEVKIMTHYLAFSLQILFQGQVSAGEARCTICLNSLPHLCVFYRAAMIDCNFFFSPPAVKPLPAVRRNAFPEQSGASGIGSVVLQKYVRGFFPLCVVAILRRFVN